MVGLIARELVALAASSFDCDQAAHWDRLRGHQAGRWCRQESYGRQLRGLVTARQCKNLLGFHAQRRASAQLGKFASEGFRTLPHGFERDLAAIESFEGDGGAWL
jgi:hypothetical protein